MTVTHDVRGVYVLKVYIFACLTTLGNNMLSTTKNTTELINFSSVVSNYVLVLSLPCPRRGAWRAGGPAVASHWPCASTASSTLSAARTAGAPPPPPPPPPPAAPPPSPRHSGQHEIRVGATMQFAVSQLTGKGGQLSGSERRHPPPGRRQ